MPLYSYRCKACNHEFEKHQRMSEEPLTDCPVCAGEIRRVINSVGIVFRGSGFYVTDNKATNPAAPSKTGDDGSANGAGSADKNDKSDKKEKSSPDATKPAKKAVKEGSSTSASATPAK